MKKTELNTNDVEENKKCDETYDIPVGATTTDLPPGVLYKVVTHHMAKIIFYGH